MCRSVWAAISCEVPALHILLRSLVFELCTRTRTGTQEEGQGHRKKRFHQDDVQDKQGLRKKMWAGQTAPFFCLFFVGQGAATLNADVCTTGDGTPAAWSLR